MYDNTALYDHLKNLKVIPDSDLDQCLDEAKAKNIDLHQTLLNHDLISDENIGKIKADLHNFLFVKLSETHLEKEVAELIPAPFAKKFSLLAINKDDSGLVTIAMSDPTDQVVLSKLDTRFGNKYKVVYATNQDIKNALKVYAADLQTELNELITNTTSEEKSEPPIIEIVDKVIQFAHHRGASDIHIEPSENNTLIRFRIDGIMHDVATLPGDLHPRLITRVKVMSDLKTDENKAAQDGKFGLTLDEERLDIRVSLIPVVNGENIVLRLLSASTRQFSLTGLGLSESDAKKLDEARQKPHGMILATGPTGSGKTTSLYALLKLLNRRGVNIMTIEDPVEYEIEGVSQIQVNKATNLTFADGLRSIVRQDPDIILVGEIRDGETAGIATNSAMTGHLVLSTLHTNDAATSIPRLIDMGVEPFLISSTVNVILAQRLVRKICPHCRTSTETKTKDLSALLSPELIKKHFKSTKTRLYKGTGCPACNNLGYTGRVGIFEIIVVSDAIRQAITAKENASIIQKIAIEEGMTTMIDDGIAKVIAGVTTIEEVMRVTTE